MTNGDKEMLPGNQTTRPVLPRVQLPTPVIIHGVLMPNGARVIKQVVDQFTGKILWQEGEEELT